jgi:hypothetical protein
VILEHAKLPVDNGAKYSIDKGAKKWGRCSPAIAWRRRRPLGASRGVTGVADQLGFEYDTREGLAARMMDRIHEIRVALRDGDGSSAARSSMRLGATWQMMVLKEVGDLSARAGKKRWINSHNPTSGQTHRQKVAG